jgi:hypothetical protein
MKTVTIEFIDGCLKGLTYVRKMDASIAYVGYVCKKPIGGSPYKVIQVGE